MKNFLISTILVALFAAGATIKAQNYVPEKLGLPGDNLNLYAVMKLFQESKTLEEFEKNLNDPNSNINNLDLNGDNLVDYIKVIDNVNGNVHNIVLQDAISPRENQDVAVITVQRFQNGQVQIQLTGDEQLYGKDYIIEPIYDDSASGGTPNPGYAGNTRIVDGQSITYVNTTPVQVASWPLISFMFLPSYVAWHSSWYWGYYPGYWHPWHQYSWDYYYGYQYNYNRYYYGHYRQSNYHRYSGWNDDYYNKRRAYSPDIHHRIEMGYYKSTYDHPDQRRDGEATFAKVHPEQYRRSQAVSNVNNSSINRRTGSTMSNQSVANPQSGNGSTLDRRSTTTVTSKTVTNHPSGTNTATDRRITTTVTDKSVKSSSGQNTGTIHNNNQNNNLTKGSAANSNRKIANKPKTETVVKKDTKEKESENKESDHRRQ
jgi:hypothetical protein